MNPDIAKYFFAYIYSKLSREIRFEIFHDPETNKYAYAAKIGRQIASSGDLDETRMDQIAYMDEVAQDILNATELVFI